MKRNRPVIRGFAIGAFVGSCWSLPAFVGAPLCALPGAFLVFWLESALGTDPMADWHFELFIPLAFAANVLILGAAGAAVGYLVALSSRNRFDVFPPVCEKCGYSLIGNESGVCPECGTKVTKA